MHLGFWGRYSYVTVAVNFDEHTLPLIRAAEALCRRSGKKLCLLNVVEDAQAVVTQPLDESSRSTLWDVKLAVEKDARRVALDRLEELKAKVDPAVPVITHAAIGKAREVLPAEALAIGSCLLMVGFNFERARFVPTAFSTVLTLLGEAPMPIMVFDGSKSAGFRPEHMKVLLADDLSDQTEAAVAFAFELCNSGTKVDGRDVLVHLHVSGLSRDVVRQGVIAAAAASHSGADPEGLADEVYVRTAEAVRAKLTRRSETWLEYFETAGGTYAARVAEGAIEPEVQAAVTEVDPDVIVFGRHHPYHTKPFFIGRVPFKAMLAPQKPVIVVPDE